MIISDREINEKDKKRWCDFPFLDGKSVETVQDLLDLASEGQFDEKCVLLKRHIKLPMWAFGKRASVSFTALCIEKRKLKAHEVVLA